MLILCISEGDFIGSYCSVDVSPPSLVSLSYSSECMKLSAYVFAFQECVKMSLHKVLKCQHTVRTYADTSKHPSTTIQQAAEIYKNMWLTNTCIPFLLQVIACSQCVSGNKAKLIPLMWNDFKIQLSEIYVIYDMFYCFT